MGLSGKCLRFVLLQMLLLMVDNAALNPTQLAKRHDCLTKCGDLEIPYPFGTKSGCYLSRDFLITCNDKTNPPIPYWGTKPNLNVTNISMEGQLQVLSPVSRDCNNSHSRFGASLNVGDFRISYIENIFTVIGCDSSGYIHGMLNKRSYSGSCNSSCEKPVDDGSCSPGSGCCQLPIPKDLRGIRVYASSSNKQKNVSQFNQCNYAFVIEDNKFHFSASNLSNIAVKVPTAVDWAITGNGNCKKAKKNKAAYACKKNTLCKDSNNSSGGYLCHCKDGYQGNPYLGCKCIKNCNKLPLGLGVGLGSVTLTVGSYVIYYEFRKRRLIEVRKKFFKQNGGEFLSDPSGSTGDAATIFPANDLEMATKNFDEKTIIGKGRNGPVYKAILKDNNPVAITKSMKVGGSQTKQFIHQVSVLSKINHRNVVKLLGCCLDTKDPFLVYEFVTNETLFDHIRNKDKAPTIPWETRLRIAAETAGVLSYMHSEAGTPFIHRDVKSSNILLDENFTAKVSDFGPSNVVPMDVTQLSTMVQNTLGYLDPEYLHTGQLTEKSDVYSFGVVLVELMTGEQALSFDRTEEDRLLVMKFCSFLKKGRLSRILDKGIINNDKTNQQQIKEVAELASRCLNVKGVERPSMKEVAMELKRLRQLGGNVEGTNEEIENLRSETSSTGYYGDGNNSTSMKDQVSEDFDAGIEDE
ncbi:hypothetical protein Dsin_022138 [Dipteronia sinensis]|uniref:Protein kinase domain-containing protein n=1 Tax=Dipteronia sinensis TaxID=43782 RepID=A0AAE0A178_9ROSI|nr:hypothetical protein Dsin_022138 [Dipteronia sinensis]